MKNFFSMIEKSDRWENEMDIIKTIDQHQNWGHAVSIKQETEL